ncbi:esterase-like activity of phytase family protein [Pseudohoeflea coraliihabitans]|uniref:esterase-like activity of phytase family protein n=1 Tax=Pseudohoeflea coraliihabitans TaxID=2860393 RepID=UPI0021038CAF|nr:esterase-like activity of phytase family protein [Pseudohoeflea sp. DP4N28-3]
MTATTTATVAATAAGAQEQPVTVTARPIDAFQIGSTETRFGDLEFVGGLELTGSSRLLGAMSAIRLEEDRSRFLGVMDTGHWFKGRIVRDEAGVAQGIEDFTITPMRTRGGDRSSAKWMVDAEGLAVREDAVLVGFERDHRIDLYPLADPVAASPMGSAPILIPRHELRSNRGLETVAVAPQDSPLAGATVAVSERSINGDGDIFAAVLDGPHKGVFFVRRQPPFDVTDGAFLPNGDLVLLERRFSISGGIGMRLRRIAGETIRSGARVDGSVLLDADFGHQIDNMEGLDVSVDATGNVYLTLVSDDNHSILQRNLLLEFRLLADEAGAK